MHKEEKCSRKKEKRKTNCQSSRKSDKKKKRKKPEKYCKFIKCYCEISIRVHERISSMKKKPAKYSFNPQFKGWECYSDSSNYFTDKYGLSEPPCVINYRTLNNSLVRNGTGACKSIMNSILRYKDYDSHKKAHKDIQKRFIDNRSIDTGVQFMIDYGLEII
ncbi:uncharacterized protein TNCV_1287531 [Trichonephila clavipes]|nr:uncharacterized protein TNCV_1287531 [Trichonephila clavipes]